MKIEIFVDSMGPGGAERVVSLLANRWAGAGHDVAVVTLTEPESDFHRVHDAVERIAIGCYGPARSSLHGAWLNLRRTARIRRLLQRHRPDAVVSFMSRMNVLVLAAGYRCDGFTTIVSERSNPMVHPTPWFVRTLRRRLYHRADAVVAQTAGAGGHLSTIAPGARIVVIPNPVSPLVPSDDRDGGLVVAAGRLEKTKGFDLLIRAFAYVARSLPHARLRIHGHGPDHGALWSLVTELGLVGRVDLAGQYTDVFRALGTADVFVLSSRYEGFPNVLLEAMALGVAPVSTRCQFGPEEILTNGEDGLLVPVEDEVALAGAISELLEDDDRRADVARAAVRSAARFNLEEVGRRWDALLP